MKITDEMVIELRRTLDLKNDLTKRFSLISMLDNNCELYSVNLNCVVGDRIRITCTDMTYLVVNQVLVVDEIKINHDQGNVEFYVNFKGKKICLIDGDFDYITDLENVHGVDLYIKPWIAVVVDDGDDENETTEAV